MRRITVLAFGVVVVFGLGVLTAGSSQASDGSELYLIGDVSDVSTDGAFPAHVTLKDPVSGAVQFSGSTLFDIRGGAYRARLDDSALPRGNYRVEVEGLEAAEEFSMAGFVNLQDVTPGAAQTGHLNISGYVLAGRIGLGTSPTLARVQVNETGTLQGVRSITNSGTAVFGQATAASGLAAGGYFTTSSVGGRAMVGDALSTTGSTVGGLFYNRSQAGVAIWGRHLNVAGASIGVFGQTLSSGGTAVMAENTGTGDTVELASANGTILTNGTLPKHQYTAGTAATMVPVAYGLVDSSGGIIGGSGNFTVTNAGTGQYDINVAGVSGSWLNTFVVATPDQSTGDEFCSWSEVAATGDIRVQVYNATNNALSSSFFTFVIYRAADFNPPNMPLRMIQKYGDAETWSKSDPAGYQTWLRSVQDAEKLSKRIIAPVLPVDEAEPAGRPGAVIRPR